MKYSPLARRWLLALGRLDPKIAQILEWLSRNKK
jgi:hypothetical protein